MSRLRQYGLIFLLFASVFLSLLVYNSKAKLETEKRAFENFRSKSASLILLKEKWNPGRDYKKIFIRLRVISKPKKDQTKGDRHIFYFENLSQISFERIAGILFNSGFIIKKLDIEKRRDKISLHVEVKL